MKISSRCLPPSACGRTAKPRRSSEPLTWVDPKADDPDQWFGPVRCGYERRMLRNLKRALYRVETYRDESGWTAKLTDVAYSPIWCLTWTEVEERVRRVIRDTLRGGNDDFDLVVTESPRSLHDS